MHRTSTCVASQRWSDADREAEWRPRRREPVEDYAFAGGDIRPLVDTRRGFAGTPCLMMVSVWGMGVRVMKTSLPCEHRSSGGGGAVRAGIGWSSGWDDLQQGETRRDHCDGSGSQNRASAGVSRYAISADGGTVSVVGRKALVLVLVMTTAPCSAAVKYELTRLVSAGSWSGSTRFCGATERNDLAVEP